MKGRDGSGSVSSDDWGACNWTFSIASTMLLDELSAAAGGEEETGWAPFSAGAIVLFDSICCGEM